MDALDKIYPSQIEKARKIVKQYHFEGFPVISKDYVFNRLKPIMEHIDGFEPYTYDLYDVEVYRQRDGSSVYKGTLKATYLSTERELYILRY